MSPIPSNRSAWKLFAGVGHLASGPLPPASRTIYSHLATCLTFVCSVAILSAEEVVLITVSGTGMESPIPDDPNHPGENYLFKTSGIPIPQEDGSVLTSGSLEEPFNPRPLGCLWQPDASGLSGTLEAYFLEGEPAPDSYSDSIISGVGFHHYSPSQGFLLTSKVKNTETLEERIVIWNRPDPSSNLVPKYESGGQAPDMPGVSFRKPYPNLQTANREGSYVLSGFFDAPSDPSDFAAWVVIGGLPKLIYDSSDPSFMYPVGSHVIGGNAVFSQGSFFVSPTISYKSFVKWENGEQQLISYEQFGTLTLGGSEIVPTRRLGGMAIDDRGRVLFHHEEDSIKESLIREDEDGLFQRLISKGGVLGSATIVSFKDLLSTVPRPLLTPDGRAVFLATFSQADDPNTRTGIWRETESGFEQLVDSSKPEQLIDFDRFQNIPREGFVDVSDPYINPDGRILFFASFENQIAIDPNDATTVGFKGIFAEDSTGKIHLVARTGQTIPYLDETKVVDQFFMTNQSYNASNRVGFLASLSNPEGGYFGNAGMLARLPVEVESNTPPRLDPVGNWTVAEKNLLSFIVTASDPDVPPQSLRFDLATLTPAGASIDPVTGYFSWQPTEAQGPGIYSIGVRVSDDFEPSGEDIMIFKVRVLEVDDEDDPPPPIDPVPDFGDAPDSSEFPGYPTLFVNDGAYHLATIPDFHLGEFVDFEGYGHPDFLGLGDDEDDGFEPIPNSEPDDEDGITFLTPLTPGTTGTLNVLASIPEAIGGNAKVDAWIDFNQDKDWTDPGEQVLTNFDVENGNNLAGVVVPADAAFGETYARFRLSREGGLSPDGPASNGEVEDYLVAVVPVPSVPNNISISKGGDGVVIQWSGEAILESAPIVTGPWDTVEGATSPFFLIPEELSTRFFRLRTE